MALGRNLGIQAKVEAALDQRSKRKLEKDVEQSLSNAERQFGDGIGGGMQSRTMGGGGGGGAAAFGAGRATSGGGGLLGGGVGGAAKMLGTVAIGGVLANRMLGAMMNASGRLQATAGILSTAKDLFFKPFGDALSDLIFPFARKSLEMAIQFNKIASDQGLAVGIASLSGDVEKSWADAVGRNFEGALETVGIDLDIGGHISNFLQRVDWVQVFTTGGSGVAAAAGEALASSIRDWAANNLPTLSASSIINSIGWPTLTTNPVIAQIGWPAIGAGAILSQIDWPTVTLDALLDALTGGGGGGGTGTGSTTGPPSGPSGRRTFREQDPSTGPTGGGGGGGDHGPRFPGVPGGLIGDPSGASGTTIEMSSRRVGSIVSGEIGTQLGRIV